MKLLIVTQSVDIHDPVLGFFVRWIEELAKRIDHIEVICLREGEHHLPAGVSVHSLGKTERGNQNEVVRRIRYVVRFISLIWRLRRHYDAVFVHMNQEYIVVGGWLWKMVGKRIYLWRNYHSGNFLTDGAMFFCTKVFCTSRHSYTAKNKKTELMPVGVDTERFFPDVGVRRVPRSILFLSGMWPSKRPEILIDALALLDGKGVTYTASFYGSPMPSTQDYYRSLKERVDRAALAHAITFYPAVSNDLARDIFRSHEIFVNCSPSGMFDKTIFEAAACGCKVLASSKDFSLLAGDDSYFASSEDLARRLESVLGTAGSDPAPYLEKHSLATLAERLEEEIH